MTRTLLLTAIFALFACTEDEKTEPTPSPVEEVSVTAEGTKFTPAVDKAALPENVWYCDMGTVHYARTEEGDRKCALCGMDLKSNAAK